jgi:hypothetical protein
MGGTTASALAPTAKAEAIPIMLGRPRWVSRSAQPSYALSSAIHRGPKSPLALLTVARLQDPQDCSATAAFRKFPTSMRKKAVILLEAFCQSPHFVHRSITKNYLGLLGARDAAGTNSTELK